MPNNYIHVYLPFTEGGQTTVDDQKTVAFTNYTHRDDMHLKTKEDATYVKIDHDGLYQFAWHTENSDGGILALFVEGEEVKGSRSIYGASGLVELHDGDKVSLVNVYGKTIDLNATTPSSEGTVLASLTLTRLD